MMTITNFKAVDPILYSNIESHLSLIKEKFAKKGVKLNIAQSVMSRIFNESYQSELGPRLVRQIISQDVENPLAELILPSLMVQNTQQEIQITVINNKICMMDKALIKNASDVGKDLLQKSQELKN